MTSGAESSPADDRARKHGRSIVDGVVKYLSVSTIDKGDAGGSPTSGCLRKVWFDKVMGIKEPETAATQRGVRNHGQVEHHLKTGDRSGLSSLPLSGMHMFPEPGLVGTPNASGRDLVREVFDEQRLLVEHPIISDLPDGSSGLAHATFRIAGIPIHGFIDLVHARPENPGVSDVMSTIDERGVLKVTDWKFPGTMDHAKSSPELVKTIQMAGYGTWGFETFPLLERVRLSHGYMPVKGASRLSTVLVDRDQIAPTWKRAEGVAVSIRDAAGETNPDKVDANTRACRAYGKQCPAYSKCNAARHNSLSSVFGRTAAARLLSRVPTQNNGPQDMSNPSSLVAQLRAKSEAARAAAGGAPANTPAPQQSSPTVAPQPSAADVQAEVARLEAEAAAARGTAPGTPAQMQNWPEASAKAAAMLAQIEQLGIGMPVLAGDVAIVYARAKNYLGTKGPFAGSGDLAEYTLDDLEVIPAALEEAQKIAVNIAAKRAQEEVTARIVAGPATTLPPSILPPDAPASNPSASAPVQAAPPAEEAPKKARARKKAPEASATPTATAPAPDAAPPAESDPYLQGIMEALNSPAPSPDKVYFYFNAVPDGIPFTSFWPGLNEVLAALHEDSGQPHFFLVDNKSKYAFNGWQGALDVFLREYAALLSPGHHVLDNAEGPIAQQVAMTMRDAVTRAGGVFIRGAAR